MDTCFYCQNIWRSLSLGVTKSYSGKQISNVLKTGTKAEILEYLNDEKMFRKYVSLILNFTTRPLRIKNKCKNSVE